MKGIGNISLMLLFAILSFLPALTSIRVDAGKHKLIEDSRLPNLLSLMGQKKR